MKALQAALRHVTDRLLLTTPAQVIPPVCFEVMVDVERFVTSIEGARSGLPAASHRRVDYSSMPSVLRDEPSPWAQKVVSGIPATDRVGSASG